jgi:hypothetical protein
MGSEGHLWRLKAICGVNNKTIIGFGISELNKSCAGKRREKNGKEKCIFVQGSSQNRRV